MKKLIGVLLNTLSIFNAKASVKIAFKLFSTPLKGKLHGQLPAFLQRATLQKLDFNGQSMQCYIWDITSKPIQTILLVHGWQSNSNRWEDLINYLPNNYRIIAIDAMGQGKSQGKQLSVYHYSQLIQQALEVFNPNVVISHSLGSFALLAALSKGHNPGLNKVVVMGSLDKFKDIVDNYYKMMGYSKALQRQITLYLQSIIQMDMESYCGALFVENLLVKTLVIHDYQDQVIPLEQSKELHEVLKQNGAQIIYTKDLDHSLQDPKVYQSIKDFIVKA